MYYNLGHDHSNLVEFQYRFVTQNFRFSAPPLLLLLVTWPHVGYVLYIMMDALFEVTTPSRSIYLFGKRFRIATTSITDHYFLYVFIGPWFKYLCTRVVFFKLFGRLHTDDRPDDTIFNFHFIRGHVPWGWFCYQYSSKEFPATVPQHLQ